MAFSTPPGSPRWHDDSDATSTPYKRLDARRRPIGQFLTPQPMGTTTVARLLDSDDDDGGSATTSRRHPPPFAKTRMTPPRYTSPQPKGLRPRDTDADVEALCRHISRSETLVFHSRASARETPVAAASRETPVAAAAYVSAADSDRATPPSSSSPAAGRWSDDAAPHETPSKLISRHRRYDSTVSSNAGGYGFNAAAAASTGVPNRNPFTPGRGHHTTAEANTLPAHYLIVNHEQHHLSAPPTRGPASSAAMTPAPRGVSGSVARYSFRHPLPWLDESEQADGGEFVPLHQDVNGTVWLANGLVDGVPYAVKEVLQSATMPHGYFTSEDQKALASDPVVATEVAALVLSAKCRYIQRYFSVQHDVSRGIHVIRAEYCPRGTLYEDILTHHMGPEERPATPFGNSSQLPRFQLPSEAELWKIIGQTFTGLAVLHQAGIAHNALSPRTVLVDDLGDCRITNFGAACRVTDDLDYSTIPPAVPVIYEPHQAEGWAFGETPFTRDVYTFGAGLLHLVALASWQVTFCRPVHEIVDRDAHVMPATSVLSELGYSAKLRDLFEALLTRDVETRPTAQNIVDRLRPPNGTHAALMAALDMEAATLRARIAELTKTVPRPLFGTHATLNGSGNAGYQPQPQQRPTYNNGSRRGSYAAPAALSRGVSYDVIHDAPPLSHQGSASHPAATTTAVGAPAAIESLIPLVTGTVSPCPSTVDLAALSGAMHPAAWAMNSSSTAPPTRARLRPQQLMPVSSTADVSAAFRATEVTSPYVRDVMSPLNGSYRIKRDRLSSFIADAPPSDRGTRTPPAESPVLMSGSRVFGGRPMTRDFQPMASSFVVPGSHNPSFGLTGLTTLASSPNRFDSAPHVESVEATPMTVGKEQRLQHHVPTFAPQPPSFFLPAKLALSPNGVREETSVALFDAAPSPSQATPSRSSQIHHPHAARADTATPQHVVSPAVRGKLAPDPLDIDDTELRSLRLRPRDAHCASVDEMLALLQRRMPNLTRTAAPYQDAASPSPSFLPVGGSRS